MREEHGQRVPCDPRQVTRVEVPYPPSPSPLPIRASWADTHHPPPEVTVLTQDDRGEHFWLNSTSLRGQAAELVTRAE